MPFVLKKFSAKKGKKIQIALMQDIALKPRNASRLIAKARVFDMKKKPYLLSEVIRDDFIYIALFEGHTRGLKPLITFEEFAIFDKPSNLMIHPISKKNQIFTP